MFGEYFYSKRRGNKVYYYQSGGSTTPPCLNWINFDDIERAKGFAKDFKIIMIQKFHLDHADLKKLFKKYDI